MRFNLSYYTKQRLVKRLIDVVMIVFLIITLFPIFWMVYCSFKDNTDILTGKIWPSRAASHVIAIENANNNFIIGTADGKISILNKKKNTITKSMSIKSGATSFTFDEKAIWIASSNKGLTKIDKTTLKKIAHFSYPLKNVDLSRVVSSVITKSENKIWISLDLRDFNKIFEFDTAKNQFSRTFDIKSDLSPLQVLSISKIDNNLVVGGDNGLLVVDLANGNIKRTYPLQIDSITTKVYDIKEHNGKVYLGTTAGLIDYELSSGHVNRIWSVDQGLTSNQVGKIYVDGNDLYLGTNQGFSVLNINSGNIKSYSDLFKPREQSRSKALQSGDALSMFKEGNKLVIGSTNGRISTYDLKDDSITPSQTIKPGHLLFRWRNYVDLWYNIDFGLYLRNSFIICGTSMLIAMIFATMAAYAFSRFKFPGSDMFSNVILATQMIPAIMYLIPIYIMFVKFNDLTGIPIKGTFPGIILIYSAFFIPFSIWILRGFFAAIPKELEEAGRIDGCTQFQVFWHIVLPLAVPGIIATGVYVFLTAWDELMFAWVLCNADTMTIPVGIRLFVGNYQNRFDLMMAAATVATLPVMLLFFLLQKHIVKGLTAGAVKG